MKLITIGMDFQWIDANNAEQSVFSFIRKAKSKEDYVIILCNFTEISIIHIELVFHINIVIKELLIK